MSKLPESWTVTYHLYDTELRLVGDSVVGVVSAMRDAYELAAELSYEHICQQDAVLESYPVGLRSMSYRLHYPDNTIGYVTCLSNRDSYPAGLY